MYQLTSFPDWVVVGKTNCIFPPDVVLVAMYNCIFVKNMCFQRQTFLAVLWGIRKQRCLNNIPEYFCCESSVVQAWSPVQVNWHRRCSIGVQLLAFYSFCMLLQMWGFFHILNKLRHLQWTLYRRATLHLKSNFYGMLSWKMSWESRRNTENRNMCAWNTQVRISPGVITTMYNNQFHIISYNIFAWTIASILTRPQ